MLAAPALLFGALGSCTLDKDLQSSDDPVNPAIQGNLDDDEYQTAFQALSMSQGYTNEMPAELFSGIGRIDSTSGSPSLAPEPGKRWRPTTAPRWWS
jgi:hypothetical protein